jgi:hypothetical protein
MVAVLEGILLKSSVLLCVFFLWAKGLNAKDVHKEMLPFYGGKCFLHKAVHIWVKKCGRCFASDYVEMEVRKWQHSKDFYAAGFDALVKRWGRYISVGGGYVEK